MNLLQAEPRETMAAILYLQNFMLTGACLIERAILL